MSVTSSEFPDINATYLCLDDRERAPAQAEAISQEVLWDSWGCWSSMAFCRYANRSPLVIEGSVTK